CARYGSRGYYYAMDYW
nr:immunoglobulin heavy chain junction region [Mus musculus]NSM06326.1 immunoglobulin heavy chain junction region [Mus musculus]NSM06523.1 immunoglobulin heavy chain junction region [Mus musculus]NSM06803.1 immunoglobulin heavy chain junction region [Mus musculus]NSM08055.1 immunoglobulin heavy chain junction region [Mus musculus]